MIESSFCEFFNFENSDFTGNHLTQGAAFPKCLGKVSWYAREENNRWMTMKSNFASEEKLTRHFIKHGNEWGEKLTQADYLKKAQSLSTAKVEGHILGFISKEGTLFRYNTVTNEFATMNSNGNIETFFRPERGLEYYLEQVKKYGN
jgi:pyocin large subunit-like protein